MIVFVKAWIATAIAFVVIDAIWLGVVAKSFYVARMGDLMRDNVNFSVAALFYVFYSAAIVYLASSHGMRESSAGSALLAGLILGLAAYGTYDITNLATLKNWPVSVTVVDMIWGGLITAITAYVGYRALLYFQ